MTTTGRRPLQPDWIAKTLAGLLLGLTLALGASGLLSLLLSGLKPSARVQLVMWAVPPVWMAVLSTCFLFRSGRRAWAWLAAANLLVIALLALTRLHFKIH